MNYKNKTLTLEPRFISGFIQAAPEGSAVETNLDKRDKDLCSDSGSCSSPEYESSGSHRTFLRFHPSSILPAELLKQPVQLLLHYTALNPPFFLLPSSFLHFKPESTNLHSPHSQIPSFGTRKAVMPVCNSIFSSPRGP